MKLIGKRTYELNKELISYKLNQWSKSKGTEKKRKDLKG